jgi:AcrR family transcriptional regulator
MARGGQNTARVIREEAAEFFFEKGYAATTLREVAAAAGLKVGSLYNHMASKEDLLLQVMGGVLDDQMELQRQALAVEGDPVEKLRAVVDCHVRFHAERAKEVFIGNTNLRSLPEDARQEIIAKRNDYERIIQSLIEQAGEAGMASVIDARLHTYSIVALGTNVASWYRPEGRMTLDEIVAAYTKFALRELQVPDADQRVEAARGLVGSEGH